MKILVSCVAFAFGSVAAAGATSAIADEPASWMRAYVQQRQHAVMQRFLGSHAKPPMTAAPEIIGGGVAPAHKWPFQVALVDATIRNNFNAQYCGGSLIGPQHVLTAAHCIDFLGGPAAIRVLTGTQSLASGGTRRRLESIAIHPKWDDATSDYDIAVIKLREPLNGINPVKLISKAQEPVLSEPGTLAYVTGWGDIRSGRGTSFPNELHEVRVPIVSRTICNRPASYDGQVTSRMLCAGRAVGGKDSCQGDSGGPLTVANANGRYRIQTGIVSWGTGCAAPDFFGVYSRLAVLAPWVEAVMASDTARAEAKMCLAREEAAQERCVDGAIAAAEAEARSYLDHIKRGANPAHGHAAETAQRAWRRSLASLCAFEAATSGETGRKSCVLRQTLDRAAMLAAHLSELDQ